MLARLGKVIYWTANTAALLWLVIGLWAIKNGLGPHWEVTVLAVIAPAILIYLAGRAVLYILANE
jgi:hypothetical protein